MEHRVPTIFEVAERAARKAQPDAGLRKLKGARKASGKTSRRPPPQRKVRRAGKRKG
jgi:hypothetical protein